MIKATIQKSKCSLHELGNNLLIVRNLTLIHKRIHIKLSAAICKESDSDKNLKWHFPHWRLLRRLRSSIKKTNESQAVLG